MRVLVRVLVVSVVVSVVVSLPCVLSGLVEGLRTLFAFPPCYLLSLCSPPLAEPQGFSGLRVVPGAHWASEQRFGVWGSSPALPYMMELPWLCWGRWFCWGRLSLSMGFDGPVRSLWLRVMVGVLVPCLALAP